MESHVGDDILSRHYLEQINFEPSASNKIVRLCKSNLVEVFELLTITMFVITEF